MRQALEKMKLKLVTGDSHTSWISCTALAIASIAEYGVSQRIGPSKETMTTAVNAALKYFRTYSKEDQIKYGSDFSREKKLFGLRDKELESFYQWLGFKYISFCDKDGYVVLQNVRFPKTCIIKIYCKEEGGGKHVVARVDGTLVDTFDFRKEDFFVVGYFVHQDYRKHWANR